MLCPDCRTGNMVLTNGVWKCGCGAAQVDLDTLRASAHVSAAAMLLPRMTDAAEVAHYRRLSSA